MLNNSIFQVINSIATKKPLEWQEYLKKFMKTSCPLPEFQSWIESEGKKLTSVGMKIINFSTEESTNCVVRPSDPSLDTSALLDRNADSMANSESDNPLKEAYKILKAIKKDLGIKVTSYMLKKVLFCPRFIKLKSLNTINNVEYSGQNPKWLVWLAIQHPSLKPYFAEKIDLDFWRILLTKQIPLGRSFTLKEFGLLNRDIEYKVNVEAISHGKFDQTDLIPLSHDQSPDLQAPRKVTVQWLISL